MIIQRKAKDIKPVLMEQTAKGLENPYYEIIDDEETILVVSAGQNGEEFNKTIGYYSNFPGMQTYICLHGSGVLLMQRSDELIATE